MADKETPPLQYETPAPRRSIRVWPLVASIFSPTLITTAGITACEWPTRHWFTNGVYSGQLILTLALLVGCIFLWRTRLPNSIFMLAFALYAILQLIWLVFFGISFECGVWEVPVI
jgi:hypothetical protein